MGDKTTLTVQEETLERFNDAKATPEDMAEWSADAFLNRLLDAHEDDADFTATATIRPTVDDDALEDVVGEVSDRFDEVIDPSLADVKMIRDELKRLEETVERIPDRTADELEGRFR